MDEQERRLDLTTATPDELQHDTGRGSAWAELDETFFRIVEDAFTHDFCTRSSATLASNDELIAKVPLQRTEAARLSHEETLARINAEIDREIEIRRAMRRHPSRRRF